MPTGFELIKQQVAKKKLGEELPIVGWFHFPLADPVADDFYAETVNTATAGHWDLIKIMTCGNYMPVAYGADYEFFTNPQKWDGVGREEFEGLLSGYMGWYVGRRPRRFREGGRARYETLAEHRRRLGYPVPPFAAQQAQ